MEVLLTFIIVFGVITLFIGATMGITWIICKALLLLFGLTVSFWGVFLAIIALQLLISMFKGGK